MIYTIVPIENIMNDVSRGEAYGEAADYFSGEIDEKDYKNAEKKHRRS